MSTSFTRLRHDLHKYPELSGQESATAQRIIKELSLTAPNRVLTALTGSRTGVCAEFVASNDGPTIMFRCELDALPIQEKNKFEYRSKNEGVAHLCGHDGHMATLLHVAHSLKKKPIARGRVLLLFQPAEETGVGAKGMVEDLVFKKFGKPDAIYAFHNVPEYENGCVLIKQGTMTMASVGFLVKIIGETSHASYPNDARNPTKSLARLVLELENTANYNSSDFISSTYATITGAQLGLSANRLEPSFGTTPGDAWISGTLRSHIDRDLEKLRNLLTEKVNCEAKNSQLQFNVSWHEYFPATKNHETEVNKVIAVAQSLNIPVKILDEPFRWSEDFAYYTQNFPGAFFGLGAGCDHVQLHDSTYDFPDPLIQTGGSLYRGLIDSYLS